MWNCNQIFFKNKEFLVQVKSDTVEILNAKSILDGCLSFFL